MLHRQQYRIAKAIVEINHPFYLILHITAGCLTQIFPTNYLKTLMQQKCSIMNSVKVVTVRVETFATSNRSFRQVGY
jgi:hypothetical protein